jgi:hypothetical protein
MKLRLQSNSIRLRLKRGEVDQLAKLGRVEEKIVIGSGHDDVLVYVLQTSPKVFAPQATLAAHTLLVELPIEQAQHWVSGDDIGIEAKVATGHGVELQILIEKDFACLNGDEEQNRDTFPNPLAGTQC